MEIYRKEFINILKANFGYEEVNTLLGPAIKMSAKQAFVYSSVTGAGYFDSPIYPFTPKGLTKLFYNAFNYKFVSGIFDNGVLKNTPYIMSQAKKYIFSGEKYIIPVEFGSEEDLVKLLTKSSNLENKENYIIQRIEISKRGNGMEPFMEYVAAEYFKNLGFIVENQIPLAHAIGSPDFAGFGLDEIIKKISSFGYLSNKGFHMIELALIRNFRNDASTDLVTSTKDMIVGEAKTGSTAMTKQLEKYLNTGLFDKGFEMVPSKSKPSKDYFGLISFSSDYKIKVALPLTNYPNIKPLSSSEYRMWLRNYIKFYLIANFTNDELKKFYLEETGKNINREADIVLFVKNLQIEKILEKIKLL